MDFYRIFLYNIAMLSLFTFIIASCALLFPTLMITITYPFSKKWALFWSNYITHRTDRLFFAILKTYCGYDFVADTKSLEGLPDKFLVVSNHQSLIDIVVYLLFFSKRYYNGREVRFVAKDALSKVPMVGKMLRTQGHCMIPRHGGASEAMKSLEAFGTRVNASKDIVPLIFPEGTRSKDGKLGTFYSAGFRRLEETVRLPVAVCALDGGWKLSHIGMMLQNLKKGAYRVKVLKVFDVPQTKEDEKRILAEAPALIQAQLDEWRKSE